MDNLSPIRIAVADDHVLIRHAIADLLVKLGFIVVIEADNGAELINSIEKSNDIPDICLLDINMPKMNGFDTLVELKKKWYGIRVLVLTVFDTEFYIIKMIVNGANGYLVKNCSPEELKSAILSIHNNGTYYSDSVTRSYFHSIQNNRTTLPTLTARELELITLCCSDLSYVEIAKKVGATTKSIEGCRDTLFKKLNITSRVTLAIFAIQFGILPLEIQSSYNNNFFKKNKQ